MPDKPRLITDKAREYIIYLLFFMMLCICGASPARAAGPPGNDGQSIYNRHCSVCHGDRGDGSSWAKNGLNPPPRNFTSEQSRQVLTRARMIHSVTNGRAGTAMMPFRSRLTASQIAQVVDYIRANIMGLRQSDRTAGFAGGLTGDAKKGGAFYRSNCYVCHGLNGDGRGPRSRFINPKPRNFTTEESRRRFNRPLLFRAIATGKRGTVMPAWSAVLSEQQIADVAEYVFQQFILHSGRVDKNDKKKAH